MVQRGHRPRVGRGRSGVSITAHANVHVEQRLVDRQFVDRPGTLEVLQDPFELGELRPRRRVGRVELEVPKDVNWS